MGAGPFELGRLAVGGGEVQRRAVVAGDADANALRREGDRLDCARVGQFLDLAVGEADEGAAARGPGNGALRACGDGADPLAAGLAELRRTAVGGDREDLAVLAPGPQAIGRRIVDRGEQAVIGLGRLEAMVETVDGALGERVEGYVG